MAQSKIILLKAIGICYVVLMNYHQPCFICIPVESFLVACFFFLLGYSFKPAYSFADKIKFLKDKARIYMLLYFVYNVAFALLRVFINTLFETNVMGPNPTFVNFFIEPFFENRIYLLSGSTWFYPQLYLTITLVQLIYYNKPGNAYIDIAYLIVTTILFLITNELSSSKSSAQVILIRTFFSMIYTFLGYIYCRHLEPRRDSQLFTSLHCFVALAIFTWTINIYPDIKYNYVNADFHQHPSLVPLTTGCAGIYLHLFFCHALNSVVNENDLLYMIAEESYHIMFLHGLSFTFVNYFVVKRIFRVDDQILDVSYRYKPNVTWPFFLISGIGIPILFIRFVRFLSDTIENQLKRWSTVEQQHQLNNSIEY